MHKLTAYAIREGKTIEVTITGSLPDSCHHAKVDDIYPGGRRVYVTDPGAAQVFIEETVKPGSDICWMVLIPWVTTVAIVDSDHDKVEIFVNNREVLWVPIINKGDKNEQFIVIALTGSTPGNSTGCSIIPKDAMYPAIYARMFGPSSYDDCKAWVASNCKGI